MVEPGLDFDLSQSSSFESLSLDGMLRHTHRETGLTQYLPFSVGSGSATSVIPDITRPGWWDFSLLDMSLVNRFSSDFGMSLVPTISLDVPLIYSHTWEWPQDLGTFYSTGQFELDFNEAQWSNAFSAYQTPEPGSFILLATGGILAAIRRIRRSRC